MTMGKRGFPDSGPALFVGKCLSGIGKKRKTSLNMKFTLALMVLFPCTMIVTALYFYVVISSILTQNMTKDLTQLSRETNGQIESQFDMVDNAALFIISNPQIKQNLLPDADLETPYLHAQRKLAIESQLGYSLFYNYAWESSLFESVYIFKDEKTYYYLNRYFKMNLLENHLAIYQRFSEEKTDMRVFPPENGILYLARNIKETNVPQSLGSIVLGIEEETLERAYTNTLGYLNALVYIYDRDGTILSCKDKSLLGTKLEPAMLGLEKNDRVEKRKFDGQQYYTAVHDIDRLKLGTLILIPEKEMMTSFNRSLRFYVIVILLAVLLAAFMGATLSSKITKPIKSMIANINKFKAGDFSVKMPEYEEYELNEMSTVFNKMTDEIQDLFQDIYEKQILLKESELKLLQSQVNPHFLFNVLDVISWEARLSGNEKVYEMITSLGQIMIANVTFMDREKITISQERDYIEFYLFLQKMRFGEKLIITIDMGEKEIGSFYIPKFCIYTVVENAIVHGLENKVGERVLKVCYRMEGGDLTFEITDNGIGFDTKEIDLNSQEKMKKDKNKHTNIGLYNANRRIRLLYGKEYGITLESKIDQGTRVMVRLPIDRGENGCSR